MSPPPLTAGLIRWATFVARSFSGDKAQLVPIIQAGLAHRGFAFIDIISPCVSLFISMVVGVKPAEAAPL